MRYQEDEENYQSDDDDREEQLDRQYDLYNIDTQPVPITSEDIVLIDKQYSSDLGEIDRAQILNEESEIAVMVVQETGSPNQKSPENIFNPMNTEHELNQQPSRKVLD